MPFNAKPVSSSADHDELVSSFLAVRRALGLAGLSLPILLYGHARFWPGGQMQPSISEFYHTVMGDILVGVLVAIGLFLIAYVGHRPQKGDKLTDWWVSTVAGVGAIGVALIPALPAGTDCDAFPPPEVVQGFVGHWCTPLGALHFISAAVFFLAMALICLFLFPKNAAGEVRYFDEPGNATYLACGIALIASIVGLAIFFFIADTDLGQALAERNIVFWLETLGVLAFAIAWLTKGNILAGVGSLLSTRRSQNPEG
ncbi:DUF998 domain-containing protein [Jannaschia aquimarina]|uniref:DUF998 domain-containing protein n=2 Tax=Jannaschia aquimarina TaxID=935700 RepID=A0A0D1ELQ7_9RHOB|nr:hypothetical protein [Jannaschia aquimarina]KIT16690.1 hypothetical protein jaqu_14780 [Jannaschia aquimarina]SNS55010.1 hypothetical protein SAMN05421775_101400 [Jannaschia aquimarina]